MQPQYLPASDPTAALTLASLKTDELPKWARIFTSILDLIGNSNIVDIDREEARIFVAQMFLGGSYEMISLFLGKSRIDRKDNPESIRTVSPVFNFFHHCRNAAFHGNKFHFKGKNPGIAVWRGKEVNKTDEGKNLFPDKLKIEEIAVLVQDCVKVL